MLGWTLLLLCIPQAFAQNGSPLGLELERFLVVPDEQDGASVESLLTALELQPGDVMQESLTAFNIADYRISDIVLMLPIASATTYLPGSASPIELGGRQVLPEFSFDGGATFAHPPLKRIVVVLENGIRTEKEVDVEPSEYTHIRWRIPWLDPQQSAVVSFRAVVE